MLNAVLKVQIEKIEDARIRRAVAVAVLPFYALGTAIICVCCGLFICVALGLFAAPKVTYENVARAAVTWWRGL